jgi:hypothetical protein
MAVDRMRCGPIGRDSIRNNLEIGFVELGGQTSVGSFGGNRNSGPEIALSHEANGRGLAATTKGIRNPDQPRGGELR